MRIKLQKSLHIVIIVYTGLILMLWNRDNYFNVKNISKEHAISGDSNGQVFLKRHYVINSSITSEKVITFRTRKSIVRPRVKNSTCSELQTPIYIANEKWQNFGSLKEMYVFSAFIIESKVIGIVTRVFRVRSIINCQLWFHNDYAKDLIVVPASVKDIPENHGKKYTSAFYTCDLPKTSNGYPYAVSLVTEKCQKPQNVVPVRHMTKDIYQFTVCVTPLNFNYSRAYELVEMIELNRILGADHFVFYNYSTNWNVDKVLEYYQKQGIVEVLQWHLPMKVDTWPRTGQPVEIHYFAQLGALNDCLYRNVMRSKYLVYQDLDEFIIPRKHTTWKDMLDSLPKSKGAYLFRNTFYRKEWPDTEMNYTGKDIAKKYKAVTLLKLKREDKILSKNHRSKYIINPKVVETVGIHNIWKKKAGATNYYVNPEIALLHHYRGWENPDDPVPRKEDSQVMIYKDELLKRLKHTWNSLENVPLGTL